VNHDPEIILESDRDSFSQASNRDDRVTLGIAYRWIDAPHEKRIYNANAFEFAADDPLLECFDVHGNVWQLWQLEDYWRVIAANR
jgi:hypothetical protein